MLLRQEIHAVNDRRDTSVGYHRRRTVMVQKRYAAAIMIIIGYTVRHNYRTP